MFNLLDEDQLRRCDAVAVPGSSIRERLALNGLTNEEQTALLRWAVITDPIAAADAGLGLSPTEAFYNACYWFRSHAVHRQARLGPDAGLEQQELKLLESAPDNVDWSVVEEILERAVRSACA